MLKEPVSQVPMLTRLRHPHCHLHLLSYLLSYLAGSIVLLLHPQPVSAQISPDPLTKVTKVGNQFNIDNGSFSSDGQNRFHNFSQFNLGASQIANFQSLPSVKNIFARIVGDPSIINGLLKVSGGNSNLFLINPSGILFGKTAQFNLPASFTATTATDLQFGTKTWSLGNSTNYATLIGDPTQFTLHPTGSIVNSGQLSVNPDQSIALISSNVINTGRLTAPSGQITIAAVPGSSLVRLSHPNNILSLEFQPIAPGQPITATSLPQLLASPNINNANGLTLTPNGKIQLTGSGLTVSDQPGLSAIDGTLDASLPGGTLQVFGHTILLASNRLWVGNTNTGGNVSGNITLTATGTVKTAPSLPLDWSTYGTTPIQITAGQAITIGDTRAPGGLTLNAPLITTGNLFTSGNPLTLSGGTLTTGLLNSTPISATPGNNGGNITLTATGNITTQEINADARWTRSDPITGVPIFVGNPGDIHLTSTGPNNLIQTQGIRARGGNTGGNVSIEGDTLHIGTGDLVALPARTAIEAQISIHSSGSIFLSQSGGSTLQPFQVGTASPNGTLGRLIANGVSLDQQIFPVDITPYQISPVSGITIESRSSIPNPISNPIPNLITNPIPNHNPIPVLPPIHALIPPPPLSQANAPNPPALSPFSAGGSRLPTGIEERDAEQRLTAEFSNLASFGPHHSRTTVDARTLTQQIEDTTGLKPALIYITFVPTQTHLMSEAIGPKTNDTLEVTLVTAKGITRKLLTTVDRGRILAMAKSFRQEVTNPLRTHTTSYLRPAQQMYQWLIAPLEAELKAQSISNLVFLPDAGLRSIPYSALHDGNAFLIQHYSVSMMPSISLTDVSYRDIRSAQMLTIGISESTQGQSPLPSVTTELTALNQLWSNSRTLKNQQATLNNLKAARSQYPFPIIHLATHGNFSSKTDRNSYIQLWGEKLQLNQIRNLGWNNPPVELLVLSACKTAIGDRETELGFAGLAVQTGVKSTIASLWSVNDTATTALMVSLYQHLKTSPIKSEALRQAQIDLALSTTTPFRHPYYWSAFTLIGNPW